MTNAPFSNRQRRAWRLLLKTWGIDVWTASLLARAYIDKYTAGYGPWQILGSCLTRTCQFEKAVAAFDKSEELATQKQLPSIWIARAEMYDYQCVPHRAEELYRKVLQADPSNSQAPSGLALSLLKRSQGEQARQARFEEAKQVHRQAIAHPDGITDEAYLNLGLIAASEEQYAEALEYMEKAVTLDPDYVVAKKNIRHLKQAIKLQKAAKQTGRSKS